MSQGYFGPKREKLYIESLHHGLLTASHILHRHALVSPSGSGSVSVRNPDAKTSFYLPYDLPPSLLSSASDIGEYKIEDGSVVGKAGEDDEERFIHSEIYKKFPGVNAVVHSTSTEVLPYAVSDVPLKPVIHSAGFLGTSVPVWDPATHYSSSEKSHALTVSTSHLGYSLATAFKPNTSAGFLLGKMKSALPTQLGGTQSDPDTDPAHLVVLVRGHGFVTLAPGIEEVVYQAVFTREAAVAQTAALAVRNAHFGGTVEGQVVQASGKIKDGAGSVQGSGKIKDGAVKPGGEVKYLSDREAGDASVVNNKNVAKAWRAWCKEVKVSPLYSNEVEVQDEDQS